MNNDFSTMKQLALKREGGRRRVSSYDRTGGNNDFVIIRSGETHAIADIEGPGCITHIWMTCGEFPAKKEKLYLRGMVLRIYWDGEATPSVEAPLGDFFGMGHARTKNFTSKPLSMGPEDGASFNCLFAMPFSERARIEIENEYEGSVRLYFYVDYESYGALSENYLRFHSTWRRQNPCEGIDEADLTNEFFQFGGTNTTGSSNYLILDAVGSGHYVGCHIDIHNLRYTDAWNWYGEGDDMIFIDGEKWPPTLHGTGMEDYFSTAWCPTQDVCNPDHGVILPGGENFSGKISLYRYHIEDPVMFTKSLRVTIEHGHNNHRSDDYSSTAYWYQTEPHSAFSPLLPVEERMPRRDLRPWDFDALRKYVSY